MRRFYAPWGIAAVILMSGALPLSAQGTITDGTALWAYTSTAGFADFEPDGMQEHLFRQWWWFREGPTGGETIFPAPSPETYTGNEANLDFALGNVSCSMNLEITAGPGPLQTTAVQAMSFTNNSAAGLDFSVFCYADFDVAGSTQNMAALHNGMPNHIRITNGANYSDFLGVGATAYAVLPFNQIPPMLDDTGTTNFTNTGLPFSTADFSGCFQWNLFIDAGATVEVYVVYTCNEEAMAPVIGPPPEQFIRGDCNNDGSINLPDAVFLLGYLFPPAGGPPSIDCIDACDTNDDSGLNLPDAVALLGALFGQPPTPLPGPSICDVDPTMDGFDCLIFGACP